MRELIDGAAGFLPDDDNLASGDGEGYWQQHRERLELAARRADR